MCSVFHICTQICPNIIQSVLSLFKFETLITNALNRPIVQNKYTSDMISAS